MSWIDSASPLSAHIFLSSFGGEGGFFPGGVEVGFFPGGVEVAEGKMEGEEGKKKEADKMAFFWCYCPRKRSDFAIKKTPL